MLKGYNDFEGIIKLKSNLDFYHQPLSNFIQ